MKKVHIRFLRQGLVEAEMPENFDEMTVLEKKMWAANIISIHDDNQIIEAMADFVHPNQDGYFDSHPDVEAIQKEDGTTIISTTAWDAFSDPEYGENIVNENKNFADFLNSLGFSSDQISSAAYGSPISSFDMVRILDLAKDKAQEQYRQDHSATLIKKIQEDPDAPKVLKELFADVITYIGFEKITVSEDYMPDHCVYIYLSGKEDTLIGIQTDDQSDTWEETGYEFGNQEISEALEFSEVLNEHNILEREISVTEGEEAYGYLMKIKSTIETENWKAFRDYILEREV